MNAIWGYLATGDRTVADDGTVMETVAGRKMSLVLTDHPLSEEAFRELLYQMEKAFREMQKEQHNPV